MATQIYGEKGQVDFTVEFQLINLGGKMESGNTYCNR